MKRLPQFIAVGLIPLLLTLPACRGKETPVEEQAATSSGITALATVNGEPVPVSIFLAYVEDVVGTRADSFETLKQKEKLLRKFSLDWVLSKKASREGLDKAIGNDLNQTNERLLANYYRQKVIVPMVKVEPAEVDAAVGEVDNEMYFSQIIVDDEDTAWEAFFRATAGEDFNELAKEYSTGFASQRGGGIGLVSKSDPRYTPVQREVIFSLEEGRFTQPLEHRFGYLLVRCDQKIPAEVIRQQKWNEINERLFQSRYRQTVAEKSDELKSKTDIWVDENYFSTGVKDDRYPYLAKVDDHLIYRDDMPLSEGMPHKFNVHSGKVNRGLLDDQIDEILFAKEAKKMKFNNTPEFLTSLNAFRIRILSSALIFRQVGTFDQVKVSEDEIEQFYRDNYKPDVYQLRFLLVPARELADNIRRDLVNGADFGRLAKRFSIDPTFAKKGELGYFVKGQLRPEFNPYLENLEIGEYSPVTKTEGGFAILQITDHKVVEIPPIEAFRERIAGTIRLRKRSEALTKFVESEGAKTKIVINREMLKDLTI